MTRIKTLLLTGRNNHDWARSSVFCRDLLRDSGLFVVTVTQKPWEALADAAALAGVELFFLDWNDAAESVGDAARANFERAVRNGAGVAFLHAANNGFRGWTELEKMAALMWREGTGHGEYHAFTVRIADRQHPITHGLDDFHTWDELYHRLVHMHGVPYKVLATAHSDPAAKGTGRDEPVMLAVQYGRGRIFHHVLGHVWKPDPNHPEDKGATMVSLENPGFQKTLLRGCQWAARGHVLTQ